MKGTPAARGADPAVEKFLPVSAPEVSTRGDDAVDTRAWHRPCALPSHAMPLADHRTAPDALPARALEDAVVLPLRAVEAALAHLARDLGSERDRLDAPRAVLAEARREAEAAAALWEYRPLQLDSCTVRELAWSARAALPAELRPHVWVATEAAEPITVDGPAFGRALAALIERAVRRAGGEVLLHGHQEDGVTTFAVVDDLSAQGDPLEETSGDEVSPALLLARRDLTRLGAELVEHDAGPHRCAIVRLDQGGTR